MKLLPRKFHSTKRVQGSPGPPPPWPVDPESSRRVAETRARIQRTRRQLELHVLPDRNQQRATSSDAGVANYHR
jgi:hypothetical protein